jgi:hypothetical protein
MVSVIEKFEVNPRYKHLVNPPKVWFETLPDWWDTLGDNKLWVDDEGRVAGLVCNWDQCIIDGGKDCWTPDRIPDGYDYAYQNKTTFDDGTVGDVAVMAATDGHAVFDNPAYSLDFNQGIRGKDGRLYDSTDQFANRLLAVKFINTEQGLAMVGSVYPHISDYLVEIVRGSAVSGHWQHIPGSGENYSFLGAVFVNKPGLPLKKVASAIVSEFHFGEDVSDIFEGKKGNFMEKICECEKTAAVEENIVEDVVSNDTGLEDTVLKLTDMVDMLAGRVSALEEAVSPMLDTMLEG